MIDHSFGALNEQDRILHRIGGKYSDSWHYQSYVRSGKNVAWFNYATLSLVITDDLDVSLTEAKINALITLGTPYADNYAGNAVRDLELQAKGIVDNLKRDGVDVDGMEKKEIVALISYLQRLGTDIRKQYRS